jgi:non-lysosomal glucosylceramidase
VRPPADPSPDVDASLVGRGRRTFPAAAQQVSMPLGGIGTGNVSIGSRGQFKDWAIFNRPGTGNELPYAFFAVRAEPAGGAAVTKVLEARLQPPFTRPLGIGPRSLGGLPRFEDAVVALEYPFARVQLIDHAVPVDVALEAFTPFIPLDADDSGIPGAIIRYRVTNRRDSGVDVAIVGTMPNVASLTSDVDWDTEAPTFAGRLCNVLLDEPGMRGVSLEVADLADDDLAVGSLVLATADPSVTIRESWREGPWWDGFRQFWDAFRRDGALVAPADAAPVEGALAVDSPLRMGSVAIRHLVAPGETSVFEFILAWHRPNRIRGWAGHILPDPNAAQVERNRYAMRFRDASAVARYLVAEGDRLERHTRAFSEAFHSTSVPEEVLECAVVGLIVLRSTTCFRIADGTLVSYEGTFDRRGACEGTCTHVWNYASTAAGLFPALERSMRQVEFDLETDADGRMAFRTNRVFGAPSWDMVAAVDGQLGAIVRLYREWRASGDLDWLRGRWPAAKRALDYAGSTWDSDGDLLLDAPRHITYDIEFHGVDPLSSTFYLAALVAGSRMADAVGEADLAATYAEGAERSAASVDALLWNGEYYVQAIEDVDAHRYQFGAGCLSDQLHGEHLARSVGLGRLLPEAHVRSALASIRRYNVRESLAEHHNVQRAFALGDEPGLLLCTWPRGGRPSLPFVYADEVWTGVEYQVAAHLVLEGMVDEGLGIVRAARSRHDGYRRDPWDEVEFGHHYVRSMAGWGVYQALTGVRSDMVERTLSIDPPRADATFRTFWCTPRAWGTYAHETQPDTGRVEAVVQTLYGDLEGIEVRAPGGSLDIRRRPEERMTSEATT